MLDKNDIQILREMFRENNETNNSALRRELRDEMQTMIVTSERSIIRQIRDETHALIRASEHRIIGEITEFIANAILPQIDHHDVRITRLEKKVA